MWYNRFDITRFLLGIFLAGILLISTLAGCIPEPPLTPEEEQALAAATPLKVTATSPEGKKLSEIQTEEVQGLEATIFKFNEDGTITITAFGGSDGSPGVQILPSKGAVPNQISFNMKSSGVENPPVKVELVIPTASGKFMVLRTAEVTGIIGDFRNVTIDYSSVKDYLGQVVFIKVYAPVGSTLQGLAHIV